jgi:hypothetical protein
VVLGFTQALYALAVRRCRGINMAAGACGTDKRDSLNVPMVR